MANFPPLEEQYGTAGEVGGLFQNGQQKYTHARIFWKEGS